MNSRIKSLLIKLDENGLDGVIITDLNNVRYFSGFTGTAAYLIVSNKKRCIVTDFRYFEQAESQCSGFEIIDYRSNDIALIAEDLNNTGFENNTISYSDYLKFSKIFKNLVPINDTINVIREIKDEEEIKNIKKAVSIADNAFSHIVSFAKAGMSEIEIANGLEFFMRRNGASRLSFDTIVASGARGAMPHGFPTDKKLQNGELVVLDFGCYFNGYASDMTRTIAVGSVSDKLLDVYNTVLKAQMSVLEKIKAGEKCADMHNIALNIIDEKYNGTFGHSLGHGVGLEIHEMPTMHPKSEKTLAEGNVVSVEPGIYISGLCGVRIEDLVLITKNSCEVLTKSTKKLIYI